MCVCVCACCIGMCEHNVRACVSEVCVCVWGGGGVTDRQTLRQRVSAREKNYHVFINKQYHTSLR